MTCEIKKHVFLIRTEFNQRLSSFLLPGRTGLRNDIQFFGYQQGETRYFNKVGSLGLSTPTNTHETKAEVFYSYHKIRGTENNYGYSHSLLTKLLRPCSTSKCPDSTILMTICGFLPFDSNICEGEDDIN